MRRQDPGGPRIDSPPQLPQERASRARVEPVQCLVEQQHIGPPDQRPCQQHSAALAIGQAQESTRSESPEPGVGQRRIDRTATAGIDAIEWDVGVEESGTDDVPDREVPLVALVLVLALRAKIRDAGACLAGLVVTLTAHSVDAALEACRRGPQVAPQQLEQHRLARAVGPRHQPALTGAENE